MSTYGATFIGPFAEWRFRGDPPAKDDELQSFVHEAGPYVLSVPGQSEYRVTQGRVNYRRYLLLPYPNEAPLPRPMNFDGTLLSGEAVIESTSNRLVLGRPFGAAEAVLELSGLDPAGEVAWFRETFREHLARLEGHYRQARLGADRLPQLRPRPLPAADHDDTLRPVAEGDRCVSRVPC